MFKLYHRLKENGSGLCKIMEVFFIYRYFLRDMEIRHDNWELLHPLHPAFCLDMFVLEGFDFGFSP